MDIDFIESQISHWPLARQNYQALGKTERRQIRLGHLTVGIQHNPARIVSTAAKTDSNAIANRPCFLCNENRPPEQSPIDFINGWELLLNPFPIFPTHFTIVSKTHIPQTGFPLDMVLMAEKLPGHTIFFNGRRAGASCPDHLHCQAVKTHELPLMLLVEKNHVPDGDNSNLIATPYSIGLDFPFEFKSIIVTPDLEGMRIMSDLEEIVGNEFIGDGRINAFVWIDTKGFLRIVAVPRNAHRPSCYGNEEGQMMISPGCIDMAGVIITPRKQDFDSITEPQLRRIYSECGIRPTN
ncbi:MAG: DUF4922 domain-containing protein [Muribaculum sp.]|nr:DUF4922 domain-containing protein [Muribaculum sp.]